MSEAGASKIKKCTPIVAIVLLFLLGFFLRFKNLGYSDYIPDESTVMQYFKSEIYSDGIKENVTYFVNHKKGPMQTTVAAIPFLITGNYLDEHAHRIPFAVISLLSILTFYAFVKKVAKSELVAFSAAFLLMVCGFTVAFGRMVQYQNLNLLFSLLSLYFFADLLTERKHIFRSSMLGTLFFVLSMFSHWDAILYLPAVLYILILFFKSSHTRETKIRTLIYNSLVLLILLVPLLAIYLVNLSATPGSHQYLFSRIGSGHKLNFEQILFSFELYNPFITIWFYAFFGVIGMFNKKSLLFGVWFLTLVVIFLVFVIRPGTHIYNLFIPLVALCGFGVEKFISIFKRYFKIFPVVVMAVLFTFLYLQSYVIFVDHRVEYPWQVETLFGLETKEYSHKNLTNNIIGFPHKRYWIEINEFLSQDGPKRGERTIFETNEVNAVSSFYLDFENKPGHRESYAIGIKDPLSFRTDYKFPQIKDKHTIHKIQNEFGRTVVNIYWIASGEDNR